ncbi:MAG: hypothetical protein ACREUZ_04430 [Burkholderiales bacterium]
MPGEDGYALVRKLRQHEDAAIAATPAVALTAHARAEDRQNAFTAGFQTLHREAGTAGRPRAHRRRPPGSP